MGIKSQHWLVLHENPWITWGTNHGNLTQIARKINEKDIRVIELKADLQKNMCHSWKSQSSQG